jgi:hypothetical protein
MAISRFKDDLMAHSYLSRAMYRKNAAHKVRTQRPEITSIWEVEIDSSEEAEGSEPAMVLPGGIEATDVAALRVDDIAEIACPDNINASVLAVGCDQAKAREFINLALLQERAIRLIALTCSAHIGEIPCLDKLGQLSRGSEYPAKKLANIAQYAFKVVDETATLPALRSAYCFGLFHRSSSRHDQRGINFCKLLSEMDINNLTKKSIDTLAEDILILKMKSSPTKSSAKHTVTVLQHP